MTEKFDVIIPARMASVRLPGKPLLDVAGKPLVVRVLDAARTSRAERIVVATDDEGIADVVRAAGGEVQMTADDHPSGTDRIAEAVDRLALADDRVIVNVQGDEPDMPGSLIDQVAGILHNDEALSMATAATPIRTIDEWRDPSVVKVTRDRMGRALYFSRASIPAAPGSDGDTFADGLRHIGIYAYRAGFVRRYSQWPRCPLGNTRTSGTTACALRR